MKMVGIGTTHLNSLRQNHYIDFVMITKSTIHHTCALWQWQWKRQKQKQKQRRIYNTIQYTKMLHDDILYC